MVKLIRPMLAAQVFNRDITAKHIQEDGYILGQPKVDGFRYLFDDGVARSRSWKVWKHRGVQAFAKDHADLIHGWDGEGTPGHTYDPDGFRVAMSDLRAESGPTKFTLWLFDNYDVSWAHYPYEARRASTVRDLLLDEGSDAEIPDNFYDTWDTPERYFEGLAPLGTMYTYQVKVKLCPTFVLRSIEEVDAFYAACLERNWEGAILRRPRRGYKHNRATTLEGTLTKIKPEDSFEAEILGTYAREKNNNEATTSALGYTARSAHKANKVAQETLGGFHCRTVETGVEFDCGVLRLDDVQKKNLWMQREKLPGKIISCISHGYAGGYDKPRTAVMVRFRDAVEL